MLGRRPEKKTILQVFVSSSGSHHRPSKRKSTEGSFLSKRKSKKARGKFHRYIHVSLGKELQEAESVLAQEDSHGPIDSSPPCGLELPENNLLKV